MKSSIKGLFVILVIVMSFVAVQSVCAESRLVEGAITAISNQPNMITVNEGNNVLTEIFGVRYKFLCNKKDICLALDDEVIVKIYEYECSDGTTILKACEITVPDVNPDTIELRPCL